MPYRYIYIINYVYLCSVPREVVPGGAMSVYSDDILDVDPTLHHRTAAKKSTHTDDIAAETQCKSQESSGGWSKLLKYWGKSTNTIIIHYSSKSIFLFNFTYRVTPPQNEMLVINHLRQMDNFDDVFHTFLGLNSVNCLAGNGTVRRLPLFI